LFSSKGELFSSIVFQRNLNDVVWIFTNSVTQLAIHMIWMCTLERTSKMQHLHMRSLSRRVERVGHKLFVYSFFFTPTLLDYLHMRGHLAVVVWKDKWDMHNWQMCIDQKATSVLNMGKLINLWLLQTVIYTWGTLTERIK